MRRTLRDLAILAVFLGITQGFAARGFAAEIGASDPHRCACGMNCGSVCCCGHAHSAKIARHARIESVDSGSNRLNEKSADRFGVTASTIAEPIESRTNFDSACMSSLPCGRGAPFSPAVGGSTRLFEPAEMPVRIVFSSDDRPRSLVVSDGLAAPRHVSDPLEKPPKTRLNRPRFDSRVVRSLA